MTRPLILVALVLFVTCWSASGVAGENAEFPSCRIPVHDEFRRYYLMMLPFSDRDFVCIRYKNATSLGANTGQLDIGARCVRPMDGTKALLTSTESTVCTEQIDTDARAKACRVPRGFGRKQGLRLTGQESDNAETLDGLYVTHGSFVCSEKFGGIHDTPSTVVARCWFGSWQKRFPSFRVSTKTQFSCNTLVLSSVQSNR